MPIATILQEFDNISRTGFDERAINSEVQKALKELKDLSPELRAEQIAFAFFEDFPNNGSGWGTYFGPMAVLPRAEGGVFESPLTFHGHTPDH